MKKKQHSYGRLDKKNREIREWWHKRFKNNKENKEILEWIDAVTFAHSFLTKKTKK